MTETNLKVLRVVDDMIGQEEAHLRKVKEARDEVMLEIHDRNSRASQLKVKMDRIELRLKTIVEVRDAAVVRETGPGSDGWRIDNRV